MSHNYTPIIKKYQFVLRVTFSIVHAVLLTLCHLFLVLFFPHFSHFFFALIGCILLPIMSLILTLFIIKFTYYVSNQRITLKEVFHVAWIPPVGIFFLNIIILPLEMMRHHQLGPLKALAATSIAGGFLISFFLQMWTLSKSNHIPIQGDYSSGASGPVPINTYLGTPSTDEPSVLSI
jgi:hypothetical protein